MKDYRQHFQHAHLSVAPMRPYHSGDDLLEMMAAAGSPPGPHPASEFWPPSFQAMPFRNIPNQAYHSGDFNGVTHHRTSSSSSSLEQTQQQAGNGNNRPVPLPSPNQLARGMQMHVNRMTKLMDHPSGLY